MSLKIIVLSLFLSFTGAISAIYGQTDEIIFAYSIKKNGGNTLVLKLTSSVSGKDMWLGVSLYPPNVKNTSEEGRHLFFPLKQGMSVKEIKVEPEFINGTFEAALWLKKLSKEDCPEDDELCQKLGYKLEGMTSYIWAYLVTP